MLSKKLFVILLILIINFGGLIAQEDMKNKVNEVLQEKESRQLVHQFFSAGCFDKCWEYIEKPNLTEEDIENMILLSNASLWHWKQRNDCEPMNLSVAYWQLGRVYALAEKLEMAKEYSQKCIDISLENKLPPFYIGYGYEALARTFIVEKNFAEARKYLAKANKELEKVTVEENKKYLKADLDNLTEMIPK